MANLEVETLVLPLDDLLQAALDRKQLEGWIIMPGTKPVGVWVICRQPGVAQMMHDDQQPKVTVGVDPRGVGILRNGKFVDEQGNEVPPPQ